MSKTRESGDLIGNHPASWRLSVSAGTSVTPEEKIHVDYPNYSLTTLPTSDLMAPPAQDRSYSCEGSGGIQGNMSALA
jgi:hypothetical protein